MTGTGLCAVDIPCAQCGSTHPGSTPHLWAELFSSKGEHREPSDLLTVWMLETGRVWCVLPCRALRCTKARTAKHQPRSPLSCC